MRSNVVASRRGGLVTPLRVASPHRCITAPTGIKMRRDEALLDSDWT